MKFARWSNIRFNWKAPLNPERILKATKTAEFLEPASIAASIALLRQGGNNELHGSATFLSGVESLHMPLPEAYVAVLRLTDGFLLSSGVKLYAIGEVEERNRTYDVASCMPGFLAIGDDSGGRMFVMQQQSADGAVYAVSMGVLMIRSAREVAPSLSAWLSALAMCSEQGCDDERRP